MQAVPRKILLTHKADAAAHASPKVSAPATCALKTGWCLCRLLLESDQRQGSWEWGLPDEGGGRGVPLRRAFLCLPLRCFRWSDPGGRKWAWIPGFTPSCGSQTILATAQLRQAKDLVAHQAHSSPLSSGKEYGNNRGWNGKRKITKRSCTIYSGQNNQRELWKVTLQIT